MWGQSEERARKGGEGSGEEERKKEGRLGWVSRSEIHPHLCDISLHVCITTERKEFLAPTPVCVEIAEFNLNPDAFLQASGYEPPFLCKAR